MDTLSVKELSLPADSYSGCAYMLADENDIWLLPHEGLSIYRWNPLTNFLHTYSDFPVDLKVGQNRSFSLGGKVAFISAMCSNDKLYLIPFGANMYVCLNKSTGKIEKWEVPFEIPLPNETLNDFQKSLGVGFSVCWGSKREYLYIHTADFRYFWFLPETGEFKEISLSFNQKEIAECISGFQTCAGDQLYACREDAINYLSRLLDDEVLGNKFNLDYQNEFYSNVVSNVDGSCGSKIYDFLRQNR